MDAAGLGGPRGGGRARRRARRRRARREDPRRDHLTRRPSTSARHGERANTTCPRCLLPARARRAGGRVPQRARSRSQTAPPPPEARPLARARRRRATASSPPSPSHKYLKEREVIDKTPLRRTTMDERARHARARPGERASDARAPRRLLACSRPLRGARDRTRSASARAARRSRSPLRPTSPPPVNCDDPPPPRPARLHLLAVCETMHVTPTDEDDARFVLKPPPCGLRNFQCRRGAARRRASRRMARARGPEGSDARRHAPDVAWTSAPTSHDARATPNLCTSTRKPMCISRHLRHRRPRRSKVLNAATPRRTTRARDGHARDARARASRAVVERVAKSEHRPEIDRSVELLLGVTYAEARRATGAVVEEQRIRRRREAQERAAAALPRAPLHASSCARAAGRPPQAARRSRRATRLLKGEAARADARQRR